MEFVKIFSMSLFGISQIIILYFAFSGGKFIKTLLLNAILGVAVLGILKVTETLSGIFIPINQYSVLACSTMGVPAVIGILILRFIFL